MRSAKHVIGGIGLAIILICLGCESMQTSTSAPMQTSTSAQQVATIDPGELVGKWLGNRHNEETKKEYPTQIEISTDTLQGKLIYYRMKSGTETLPFQGKIQDGELRIELAGDHWARLKLFKVEGGRLQLSGTYQNGKAHGMMLIEKK